MKFDHDNAGEQPLSPHAAMARAAAEKMLAEKELREAHARHLQTGDCPPLSMAAQDYLLALDKASMDEADEDLVEGRTVPLEDAEDDAIG